MSSLRFQKRLQLNLLQLVDAASNQFKTTQKNPVALEAEAKEASHMRNDSESDENGNANAALPDGQEGLAKRTRKKRASFTDMPKI